MPSIDDWTTTPLAIVDKLFEDDNKLDAGNIVQHFTERLQDQRSFDKIPSLNSVRLHNVSSGSLVRFRCMIQDMYDPEFFLGAYTTHDGKTGAELRRTGLFRDIIDCQSNTEVNWDCETNRTMDRQTLYCIPVPGEASWVKEEFRAMSDRDTTPGDLRFISSGKRGHDDEGLENISTSVATSVSMDTGTGCLERESECDGKRIKREEAAAPPSVDCLPSPDLNFPLPSEKGPACLVKIYDQSRDDLKLNDVIEVVGVLSTDPALVNFTNNDSSERLCAVESMECAEEESVHNPPPSLVPRIHAVYVRKLEHCNPLVPLQRSAGNNVSSPGVDFPEVRDEILAVFEKALFCDRLAAEYLLCHVISSVYARHNVVALGKFALNLTNCPLSYAPRLYALLERFVTKSYFLQMTLANMNSVCCVPRKDYTANRLKAGLLQLSAQTHLVLDETALETGLLDAKGVVNMTALGNVVNWQKLDYDFNFHQQPFHTDIVTLILSEGKSLLKSDCPLPLVVSPESLSSLEETFNGIDEYLTPALLTQIRVYLTAVRTLEYSLTDSVQKLIEDDFVVMRRNDPANMTVDDFHQLLTLARLLSLTHGQQSLTIETWQAAKHMEADRKHRLTVVG